MPEFGYDFSLTVSGTTRDFMLAVDENNRKQWRVGLAPALAPQQRLSANNLYEGSPPEINTVFAAEEWQQGAGYLDAIVQEGVGVCRNYNYSRGIDLSFGKRAYISPKRTAKRANVTALAGAPTEIRQTSLGTFMLAGTSIYEWDTTNEYWVERDDASADAVNYKGKITEHNGVLYAARGTTAAYKYSTDGTTWTVSTLASDAKFADDFCTRGDDGTNLNTIVRLRAGRISVATDGTNTGPSWSAEDTIGPTNETARYVIEYDDLLVIYKVEGIYTFDFVNVDDVWKSEYIKSDNALHVHRGSNGLLYSNYGDRLQVFDPVSNELTYIFPTEDMDGQEVKGSITGITGDDFYTYLTVKNPAGNTYVVKGDENGWHTIAYPVTDNTVDTTEDSLVARLVGPGAINTNNPALVTGYGTTDTAVYILPRAGMRPEDDSNYLYETVPGLAGAYVVGPWVNFGADAYSKFLNRGTVLAENLTAARTLQLMYEIDNGGTEVEILTTTTSGFSAANLTSAVSLNRVRYVVYAVTGADSSGPVLLGLTLQSTLNPPRFRVWDLVVALSPELEMNNNVRDFMQDSDNLEDFLFNATTQRTTLYDRRGRSYVVKVNNIQSIDMSEFRVGDDFRDALLYSLQLVEINPIASDSDALIWNQDDYNSGKVWA